MKNIYKKHIKTGRNSTPAIVVLKNIILAVSKELKENTIISIAGPGGCGKSTYAKRLQEKLSCEVKTQILELDNYRLPRAERTSDQLGSHPDSNDLKLAQKHLKSIKGNKKFNAPIYDKVNGTVAKTKQFSPSQITIFEGELSSAPQFNSFIDISIFIDSDWKTQLNSRIGRDIQTNDFDKSKAIQTFLHSNLKEFQRFGAEGKGSSDIHLFSDENYYVSIEAVSEEIYQFHKELLKDYKEVILDGDVYATTVTIDGEEADLESFVKQLTEMHSEGIERIIINDCPLSSFYLSQTEKLELLSLAEEYFPGVIIYQLTNAPKESVLSELNSIQKHSIDAFTIDLKFFEYHLGVNHLRSFVMNLINSSDIPLFFFKEDFADFCTYFVKNDKMKIAPISKCKK